MPYNTITYFSERKNELVLNQLKIKIEQIIAYLLEREQL